MIGSISRPNRFGIALLLAGLLGCDEPAPAPPSSGGAPSLAEITARREPAPPVTDVVPTISDTIPGPGSHGASVASSMRGGGGGAVRRRRERREWNRSFENLDLDGPEAQRVAEELQQRVANARGEDFCERLFNAGSSLGGLGGLPDDFAAESGIDGDVFAEQCRQLPRRTLRCIEAQFSGEDVDGCRRELRAFGRQNAAGMAPDEREDRSVMRRMVESNSVMRAELGRSVMRTDVRDLASRRRHP